MASMIIVDTYIFEVAIVKLVLLRGKRVRGKGVAMAYENQNIQ